MQDTKNRGQNSRFTTAKEKISEWLLADEWKIQEGASEPAAWVIIAEDSQGKKVVFAQLNRRPDLLLIQASVSIAPDVRTKVLSIRPIEERENLLWDIRFQLLNAGLKFSGVEPELEKVTVKTRLYLEDLRRNEFVQIVSSVQDSILAVIWTIQRKLGQPAPPEPTSDLVM